MASILLPRINNLEDDQAKQKSNPLPGTPLSKTRKGPNLPPTASSLKDRYTTPAVELERRKSVFPKINDLAVSATGVSSQLSQEDIKFIQDAGRSDLKSSQVQAFQFGSLGPLLLREKGVIDELSEEGVEEVRKAMQGQIKRLTFANGSPSTCFLEQVDYDEKDCPSLDPSLVNWEEFNDEMQLKENLQTILLCKKVVLKFMVAKPLRGKGIVAIPVFHCPKCFEAWKKGRAVPENCTEIEVPTRGLPMALAGKTSEILFADNDVEIIEIKEKKTYTPDEIQKLNRRRKTVIFLNDNDDFIETIAPKTGSKTISRLVLPESVISTPKLEKAPLQNLLTRSMQRIGAEDIVPSDDEQGLFLYGGLSEQQALDLVYETDSRIFLRKVTKKDSQRIFLEDNPNGAETYSEHAMRFLHVKAQENENEVKSKELHFDMDPQLHLSSPGDHESSVTTAWSPSERKAPRISAKKIADVKDEFAAAKDFLRGVPRNDKKQRKFDLVRQSTPESSGYQSAASSSTPDGLGNSGISCSIEMNTNHNGIQAVKDEMESAQTSGFSSNPVTIACYPPNLQSEPYHESIESPASTHTRSQLGDIPENEMTDDTYTEVEDVLQAQRMQGFCVPVNEGGVVHKIEFGASVLPGLDDTPAKQAPLETDDPREVLARMQKRRLSVGMKKNSSLIEGKRKSSKQIVQSTSGGVQQIVMDQPLPRQHDGNAYIKRTRRGSIPVSSEDRYVMQGSKQQGNVRGKGNQTLLPDINDSRDSLGLQFSSTNYSKASTRLREGADMLEDDARELEVIESGRSISFREGEYDSSAVEMKMKLTRGKPRTAEELKETTASREEGYEETLDEELRGNRKQASKQKVSRNRSTWSSETEGEEDDSSTPRVDTDTDHMGALVDSSTEVNVLRNQPRSGAESPTLVSFSVDSDKPLKSDKTKLKDSDAKTTKKSIFAVSKFIASGKEQKERSRRAMPPTPSPDLKEKTSLKEFYGLSMRRFTCSFTFSFFELPVQYRDFNEGIKSKISKIGRTPGKVGRRRKSEK